MLLPLVQTLLSSCSCLTAFWNAGLGVTHGHTETHGREFGLSELVTSQGENVRMEAVQRTQQRIKEGDEEGKLGYFYFSRAHHTATGLPNGLYAFC